MDELFAFPPGRRSFFLGQISEPSTNQLRLVLLEGTAQGPVVESIDGLGIPGVEVLPMDRSKALVLHWESYVSYAVRNETYAHEQRAPKAEHMLNERDVSAFKDFVTNATRATADYPGRMRHFEILCENHVIDVVSTVTPIITREMVDPGDLMKSTVRVFIFTGA